MPNLAKGSRRILRSLVADADPSGIAHLGRIFAANLLILQIRHARTSSRRRRRKSLSSRDATPRFVNGVPVRCKNYKLGSALDEGKRNAHAAPTSFTAAPRSEVRRVKFPRTFDWINLTKLTKLRLRYIRLRELGTFEMIKKRNRFVNFNDFS